MHKVITGFTVVPLLLTKTATLHKITIRNRDLTDIALRVRKRAEYFRYFHNICISERKRAALQAYWVLQLRPFTIDDERYSDDEFSCLVNEHFAAYILIENIFGSLPSEQVANSKKNEASNYFAVSERPEVRPACSRRSCILNSLRILVTWA